MTLIAKVGATELDESFERTFSDELAGAGSWTLVLANDDPDMPDHDDVVVFELDGEDRFPGLVERKVITALAPGEKRDHVTALSGRGALVLWNRTVVQPSRGWDAVPIEKSRSWFWGSIDFDDSEFVDSKRIRRSDVATALPPNRFSPEWWPDPTSYWVWADRVDVSETSAPGGRCLFRQTITLADDATLAILVGMDNYGTVFFDGARIIDSEHEPSSYTVGNRFTVEASAGDHVLAANVLNTGGGGGLNWTVWTVDAEGLLDTLVAHSDFDVTKCLEYPFPDNPPTVTAGWVLRQVLEEAQADDELTGWTLDFDDDLDSDGNPWDAVSEVTVEVGRKGYELIESLMDWLIDAQRDPASNTLRAWNWGTRGGTPGVTIVATNNPDTSEIEGLTHDGIRTRANRLRISYKHGYTDVEDAASIAAVGVFPDFLDLGDVDTETTAKGIGTRQLALRKAPSYAHRLALLPASSLPYATFDNGDLVTHPDETGGSSTQRVRSITVTQDENGKVSYVLSTNDIRQEVQARQENWLKRDAMGTLAGGSRVTARSGESLPSASRIATNNTATISGSGPLADLDEFSIIHTAEQSGNLIEVYGRLTTPGTGSEVDVLMDGSVIATLTWASGEDTAEVDLGAAKVYRDVNAFQAQLITAGGAEGVDIQIRTI